MDMSMMSTNLPSWVSPVAWVFLALALVSAAVIAVDIWVRGHRHPRLATELVWVGSALYLGPFALALYVRSQRITRASKRDSAAAGRPDQRHAVTDALPGGTASAVAHLIGVPLVIASGLTIAGIDLWVMIIVIAVLATILLFIYDRSTTTLPVSVALGAAVLTVVAFDIGMGGWMLLLHFNELMPAATEGSFWFLMQIGIVLGLITGYPVIAWLARRRAVPAPLTA